MGKHSKVEDKVLRPKDYWPTVDPDSVKPLIPFVKGKSYYEPCCGAGDLVNLLGFYGSMTCVGASDVEPRTELGVIKDATELTVSDVAKADFLITNPPFSWKWLQPLLEHLPSLKPTWLLLPADVAHNVRMGPYMKECSHVVSVGRLYWILDNGRQDMNGVKGKDNFAWFLFPSKGNTQLTRFVGRQ